MCTYIWVKLLHLSRPLCSIAPSNYVVKPVHYMEIVFSVGGFLFCSVMVYNAKYTLKLTEGKVLSLCAGGIGGWQKIFFALKGAWGTEHITV